MDENFPKKWDGKVSLVNKRKKWSVHKMIEYPINGLCQREAIATDFETRYQAKKWVEQYIDLEII